MFRREQGPKVRAAVVAADDRLVGVLDRDVGEAQFQGAGQKLPIGGQGNDSIAGNGGADSLVGEAGDDTISGGLGNDTIDGGIGNDTLNGGSGVDYLYGEGGADMLTGGANNDYFVFSGDTTSDDTITDMLFDFINLAAYAITYTQINFVTDQLTLNGGTGGGKKIYIPGVVTKPAATRFLL